MNCMEYFESFDHFSEVQSNTFYAFPSKSCQSSKKTLSKVDGNYKKMVQKISLKRLSSSSSQNENFFNPNSLHLSVKQRISTKIQTVNQLPHPIYNKQNINKRHYKNHNHSYSAFNTNAINGFSSKLSSKCLNKTSFKPVVAFQHRILENGNQEMKSWDQINEKKRNGRLVEWEKSRKQWNLDEKDNTYKIFESTTIHIKEITKNKQKPIQPKLTTDHTILQSHQLSTKIQPTTMHIPTFTNNLTSQSYTSSSNFLKPEAPKNSRITRPSLALSLQEVAYIKTQSVGSSENNLQENEFSVVLGSLGSFNKNIKRVSSTYIVGESKVLTGKKCKGVTERRIKQKRMEKTSMKVLSEC